MKKHEVEKIEKEIEEKKKLPEETKKQVFKKVVINYIVAILIIIYFLAIDLSKIYLNKENFVLLCRIATGIMMATTFVLFEISYKKDKGTIALYGIDTMIIALFTLFVPYMFYELNETVVKYIMYAGLYMAIYYIIKSIIVYKYQKAKKIKELNDIKEIVKKHPKRKKQTKTTENKTKQPKESDNNVGVGALSDPKKPKKETKINVGVGALDDPKKENPTKKKTNVGKEKTQKIKKETKKVKEEKKEEFIEKPKTKTKKTVGVDDPVRPQEKPKEEPIVAKKRGRPRKVENK